MTAQQLQQILSTISPVSLKTAEDLLPFTTVKKFSRGEHLEKSGSRTEFQFILLNGVVRKYVLNNNNDEFTIGFFSKDQAVTPAILRSSQFISFVNLDIVSSEAEIVLFDLGGMEQNMAGNDDLKLFGYHVLMQDSLDRAEREMIILKADGKEKLNWFRTKYPNLENEIPHYHIASFLGLTTTSLSRVRKALFR